MQIRFNGTANTSLLSSQENNYKATNMGDSFQGIMLNKANEKSCMQNENLIGKYKDGILGADVEVYEIEKGGSGLIINTMYNDGRTETKEVNAETIDASNCSIIDLFAKMKYLEKNGKCENVTIDHVVSHLYLDYRKPNADINTKINFKQWFKQQLELEKSQGNILSSNRIEKLLLYL